jgi:hypothetical protein
MHGELDLSLLGDGHDALVDPLHAVPVLLRHDLRLGRVLGELLLPELQVEAPVLVAAPVLGQMGRADVGRLVREVDPGDGDARLAVARDGPAQVVEVLLASGLAKHQPVRRRQRNPVDAEAPASNALHDLHELGQVGCAALLKTGYRSPEVIDAVGADLARPLQVFVQWRPEIDHDLHAHCRPPLASARWFRSSGLSEASPPTSRAAP